MHARFLTIAVALALALGAMAGCSPHEQVTSGSESGESSASPIADPRLDGVVSDGESLSDDEKTALSNGSPLEPEEVLQYPEFESGCEIASLVSALRALGFKASIGEIADEYLTVDGDYRYGYVASPRTDFGGGFPPGVVDAANAYLEAQDSSLAAHDLTGSDFDSLAALANAGHPVLVWTTLDTNAPNYDANLGAFEDWYVNEHCVTLYSASDGTATVADPLRGISELDAADLADVYAQCGSMAACMW